MAKLKDDAIGQSDLAEFIANQSDFAFELAVLQELIKKGFSCDHGGTYEDPSTQKLRQFDIRAKKKLGYASVALAVECKQVRPNFPLLILRVPRHNSEAAYDLLLVVDPDKVHIGEEAMARAFQRRAINIPIRGSNPLYPPNHLVGKSCSQVGRDMNGLTGTDSEMFGKWSQAINSAQGLIDQVCSDQIKDREGWLLTLVLPIVVVPDDRLWVVDFDTSGKQSGDPQKANRCSYLVSVDCYGGDNLSGTPFLLSHLEFVTVTGLIELIETMGDRNGPNSSVFPFPTREISQEHRH